MAFASLFEPQDDEDISNLPQRRGQRGKSKKERGPGVVVLGAEELASRRRRATTSTTTPSVGVEDDDVVEQLRSLFPKAPIDLIRDVVSASSDDRKSVEEAAEALRTLGLGYGDEVVVVRCPSRNQPETQRPPAMLTTGFWGSLPPDMQRVIHSMLGPRDAARAALACRELAARARASRARARDIDVAPALASTMAIEGQVAAHSRATGVSLARWKGHLIGVEEGIEAEAEAAIAGASSSSSSQRRRRGGGGGRSDGSNGGAAVAASTELRYRLRDHRVEDLVEGALRAVARGAERRRVLFESSSTSRETVGGGSEGGAFYLPTVDYPRPTKATSRKRDGTIGDEGEAQEDGGGAASLESLVFPTFSFFSSSPSSASTGLLRRGRARPSSESQEEARGICGRATLLALNELFPRLESVRFEGVDCGAPSIVRALSRPPSSSLVAVDDDDAGPGDDDGGFDEELPPSFRLASISIVGAKDLDDAAVRMLLSAWGPPPTSVRPTPRPAPPTSLDLSRCPLVTAEALSSIARAEGTGDRRRRSAVSPPAPLSTLKHLKLDGCDGIERFELGGLFPNLESLSLRGCKRLAEIVVVGGGGAPPPSSYDSLVRLRVSGCPLLRSIARAASLRGLRELSASGCPMLSELPSSRRETRGSRASASPASAEAPAAGAPLASIVSANFFGCRSLPSAALEGALGTADDASRGGSSEESADASPAASSDHLVALDVNGCVSLSRIRVSSPELVSLDASGCRSCCEIDLSLLGGSGPPETKLRSLRLDGCRELRRLTLPPSRPTQARELSGGGGEDVGEEDGGRSRFLDPASTSAAGVVDEGVLEVVAAATVRRRRKKSH